jgi:AcrR family transcriptional regulator
MKKNSKIYLLKRNEILRVSGNLFLKNGFEKTTILEIAKEVGFTRNTIYSYFNSKDEIIINIYLDSLEERFKFFDKKLSKGKTGLDKIKIYGDMIYKFYIKNPLYLSLQLYFLYNVDFIPNLSPEVYSKLCGQTKAPYEKIKGMILDGIEDGSIKSDISVDSVNNYISYIFIAVLKKIVGPSAEKYCEKDRKGYYYQFLDIFIDGLATK